MSASFKNKNQYGSDDLSVQSYLQDGELRAMDLGNRGPIKFDNDGQLSAEIRNAYSDIGFYVFENVIGAEELKDIEKDLHAIMDNLPEKKGAELTKRGKPAIGVNCQAPTLFWSKPLGDPFGELNWRMDVILLK